MEQDYKKITPADLAGFFLEKADKNSIIPELFNLFGFDCMVRSSVNHSTLDKLIRAFEDGGCRDAQLLTQIITVIRSGKYSLEKQESLLLEQIKGYIDTHLTEDLRMEEVADALHVSYYYLCHFFKQQTGLSPNAYKNRKRLEKAIRLLTGSGKRITDIASACGFSSVSYFTEVFVKHTGSAPSAFRSANKDTCFLDFYDLDDMLLASKVGSLRFMPQVPAAVPRECVKTFSVMEPNEQFSFLHEAAIIEYHGTLYASWYNCTTVELHGYTPVCGKRSRDGGKTWTELEILAEDKSEKIMYCPPVYGICDDKLYLFMNQLVAPDCVHALDLYVLNNETDKFELLWSRPIPFKLNTNVVALPNGKLMLPGRIGELDRFPNTPAVLISDSGKIDGPWRLVKIAPNGDLPDGTALVHPEISVIVRGETLYMFCRNDKRRVPLLYISHDCGETWSSATTHDFPYVRSKLYCGTLTDGRNYLIANVDNFVHKHDRSRLCVYFSKPGTMEFDKKLTLFDTVAAPIGESCACHYPAACESGGKLYVIATRSGRILRIRGAVLFEIDLAQV